MRRTPTACAAGGADIQLLIDREPHVVVLRRAVRALVNRSLVRLIAAKHHQRLYIWKSIDRVDHTSLQALAAKLNAEDTCNVGGYNYFFPGMDYLFANNEAPQLGYMKNARCKGESIVLDPREPDDDLQHPFRFLRYLPLAVCVHPSESPFPMSASLVVPITPVTHTTKITLPESAQPTCAGGDLHTATHRDTPWGRVRGD